MRDVHRILGLSVAAVFLLVFIWGTAAWIRNRDPGPWFWRVVAFGQVGVVVQILIGLILYARGGRPSDPLHYAYGLFPLLILAVAHRSARRFQGLEWAVFAIAGLVIFGLMSRGFMTGMEIGASLGRLSVPGFGLKSPS
ncbi:MAG: hypothetical protein ACRDJG_12220 [Actinomycetota bacterium]